MSTKLMRQGRGRLETLNRIKLTQKRKTLITLECVTVRFPHGYPRSRKATDVGPDVRNKIANDMIAESLLSGSLQQGASRKLQQTLCTAGEHVNKQGNYVQIARASFAQLCR